MRRGVITILGTVGGRTTDCHKLDNPQKALYHSQIPRISEEEEVNTLPILIKAFGKEGYDIISLHTPCARQIQEEIIATHEDQQVRSYTISKEWEINDRDFDGTFSKIYEIMVGYDRIVIDVSHGFRHLPILMIVDTLIQSSIDITKIEHILFAKETIPRQEYEIIDLKRYIDLANFSYAIASFTKNYTTLATIRVSDRLLQSFLDTLAQFSHHILANSFDALLKDRPNDRPSIVTQLLQEIEKITEGEEGVFIRNLSSILEEIRKHLRYIQSLQEKLYPYERLYYLARLLHGRGYYLNAITLLSEAVGAWCSYRLRETSEEVKKLIREYERQAYEEKDAYYKRFSIYTLYNQSKNFCRYGSNFKGLYLSVDRDEEWNIRSEKITALLKEHFNQREFPYVNFLKRVDRLRNNLSHANSSERLEEVAQEIGSLLSEFDQILYSISTPSA
ncbi:MAG: CRISPR-associated DxTHG motif protein [Epsilonproteobacteria bacterium]|nr:hypothetical protein [Campylobacterota bacterium]NPA56912.1 CRISPR-associated DxTHG motif protein [Campylobacterota bacterium]